MTDSYIVTWRSAEIGRLSNLIWDMWYIDGFWKSNGSEAAQNFERLAAKFKSDEIIKTPIKGTIITLKNEDDFTESSNFLVLVLHKDTLGARLVSDEIAAWVSNNKVEVKSGIISKLHGLLKKFS